MVKLIGMVIWGTIIGVLRDVDSTVEWLFLLWNVWGESSVYTWRCTLCHIFVFPASMWFTAALLHSFCISPHHLPVFSSCLSPCTLWITISGLMFLFLVAKYLSTSVIVFIFHISRLIEVERKMGVFFVQCGCNLPNRNISSLSILPFHAIVWIWYSTSILQLHSFVWLWYVQLFLSWSMEWILSLCHILLTFLPPPSVYPICPGTGRLPAVDVWHSMYWLAPHFPPYP